MSSSHNPNRLVAAFDDDHTAANAAWCCPPRWPSAWALRRLSTSWSTLAGDRDTTVCKVHGHDKHVAACGYSRVLNDIGCWPLEPSSWRESFVGT
jgi:hypothetical protein